MLRDSLVVVSMPWKIPARGAEYSLTESAFSPFQAKPTQDGQQRCADVFRQLELRQKCARAEYWEYRAVDKRPL
jgi:hypothetical protein